MKAFLINGFFGLLGFHVVQFISFLCWQIMSRDRERDEKLNELADWLGDMIDILDSLVEDRSAPIKVGNVIHVDFGNEEEK